MDFFKKKKPQGKFCKTKNTMPIHTGDDRNGLGPYWQWGNHGAKYHFTPGNDTSRKAAYHKAARQAAAAHAHGYRGD